ncbi:MAG: URC4/urg3 family protein, partial [Acetobacteraceae bacterium]|nr:URC4/urg3 family protein [Acetobacteraceae bacterium]
AALLRRPGAACADLPGERPGGLFDLLAARGGTVAARDILIALLRHLGPVWPRAEGDVWQHPALGPVPFHKLSQWLAYSLIEPLEEAGLAVTGLDTLTGLPEYRNGGLFLDGGALALRDPEDAARTHAPGDPLIVEWRALTVALLDRIAPLVRAELGVADFPLARVLEGGTWFAGRELAAERRADGGPPLRVESDGTVF